MVRAMALEFPNEGTAYTKDSQYQYMWGPNLLVAPIYNGNQDEAGIQSVMESTYQMKNKSGLTYLQAKNIKVAVS